MGSGNKRQIRTSMLHTCKAQGNIIHRVHHHSCVGRRVLSDAPKPLLQHMVAIQELHLIGWFHPDLREAEEEWHLSVRLMRPRERKTGQ